jgi:hypothetical protein
LSSLLDTFRNVLRDESQQSPAPRTRVLTLPARGTDPDDLPPALLSLLPE